jgi:hypothetical protein
VSNNAFTLRRVLAAWSEGNSQAAADGDAGLAAAGDVTWTHASLPGTSWTAAGGDAELAASAPLNRNEALRVFAATSTFNLVSDVEGWVNAPESNFGLLIRGPASALATFASRENATVALQPALAIDYTPPPCVLTVDGVATTFDLCRSLPFFNMGGEVSNIKLFWTLLGEGRLRLGMQSDIGSVPRWVAIAFPVTPSSMDNARALMLRPGPADVLAATLAKDTGVTLDAAAIPIESKQAWHIDTVLSAVLTVSGFNGLATQNILYGWGPYGLDGFEQHTRRDDTDIQFGTVQEPERERDLKRKKEGEGEKRRGRVIDG